MGGCTPPPLEVYGSLGGRDNVHDRGVRLHCANCAWEGLNEMRNFVIEMGTGVDLHGQDGTKAAVRAVRSIFNHVSLPGIRQVAGVKDMSEMAVELVLGVPEGVGPVDVEEVKQQFPYGVVTVKVQPGGLIVTDQEDPIIMVNAMVFVRVP
jgi:uncharacterized protein (TIGR02058 family)